MNDSMKQQHLTALVNNIQNNNPYHDIVTNQLQQMAHSMSAKPPQGVSVPNPTPPMQQMNQSPVPTAPTNSVSAAVPAAPSAIGSMLGALNGRL